jgi:putative component of toxin-antitoxin plasmid stabilization module
MFTVRQTEEFVAWLDALKDKRAQIRSRHAYGKQKQEISASGSQSKAGSLR